MLKTVKAPEPNTNAEQEIAQQPLPPDVPARNTCCGSCQRASNPGAATPCSGDAKQDA